MPSIRIKLLNTFLRLVVKRRVANIELTPAEIAKTRAQMDRFGRKGGARRAALVDYEMGELGGVPLCWVEPKTQSQDPRPVILHLHGGAYFVGSSDAYRPFAANLALAADARVGVLDYRLAPEAPYPAAPTDALDAYRALLRQGVPAQRIAISGDSAGGNLALVTLMKIQEARLPTPCGGVLLSPWADLTGSGESIVSNAKSDAMLPAARIAEAAHMYAGDTNLRNWRVSPLFGEYAGLPPLTIHVGAQEILRDDARRVAACAEEAGVEVTLREWQQAPHVFPIFADLVPEGRQAISEIASWITQRLPDRGGIDNAPGIKGTRTTKSAEARPAAGASA